MIHASTPVAETTTIATSAAGTRVRTVYIWQLSFAAVVAITVIVAAIVDRGMLALPTVAIGVLGILATTVVALLVPWERYPNTRVVILPYLGIVWIGFATFSTDLRLSHLWVFPIAWLAALFPLRHLVGGLVLVGLIGFFEVALPGVMPGSIIRAVIALLALAFVGLTVHLTARQEFAYRTLLQRQGRRTRKALDAVTAERRRSQEMLEHLHIAVARVGRSGELLAANTAYRRLYAIDDDDPSQPARAVEYDALRGDALRAGERSVDRAARGETLTAARTWLFDPDGRWHALSITTQPLPPQPDEDASALLIAEDLTEQLAGDDRRDELAALLSHELRNPLTAILGTTDSLLESELPDRTRERVTVVDDAATRMMQIITTILPTPAESPPARGRDPRTAVDLARIVEASVETFAPTAKERDVRLTLSCADAATVWGDAFRLRQLVDNLIGNAVKYTPAGGRVAASVRAGDGETAIVVADTGIGIPEADIPRVFDPSFRSSHALEAGVPGTGLGLAVVRDVVEAHGGRLELHSEVGAGTTVTVTLPTEDA